MADAVVLQLYTSNLGARFICLPSNKVIQRWPSAPTRDQHSTCEGIELLEKHAIAGT
jgi:hypothetical protein